MTTIQLNLKYNYFINSHIVLLTVIILKNIMFHYKVFRYNKICDYIENKYTIKA
jgi:hypothetical protein